MLTLSPRRIKQILAIAILVPTLALVVAIVSRQQRASSPETVPHASSPNVDMSMNQIRFSEMRDDATLWELVAERADYDKEPGVVHLKTVRLETFEGKTGGVVITSQTAKYQEAKRLVTMEGAVHAVTRKGMVFDTDQLQYLPVTSMLSTNHAVSVLDGRLRLQARGMEASLKTEQVRFLTQVNAVIEGNHANR
jgi:LPS export ABC transporter protein LptC